MPFEIQHQTQHLWEAAPRWNFIARHETLARCVEGCKRILTPYPGTDVWDAEDTRIAKYDAKQRLLATYDTHGNLLASTKAKVPA